MPPKILILAGEESGDAHGAALVTALRALEPAVEIEAWGGRRLADAGARLQEDVLAHAVMGVRAVLPKLPYFRDLYWRICARVRAWRPDVVIPIDNPGLNLRVAARARRVPGVRVLYYVSPQIWAWWPWRVRRVIRSVDKMLVILPFEESIYRERGGQVEYVGHPLFDYIEAERQDPLDGGSPEDPLVALLPGSRQSEVAKLLPLVLDAAVRVRAKRPRARFALPAARAAFVPAIEEAARARGLEVAVLDGRAHDVMRAARVAIVASGTATLECLYFRLPMVIVYRVGAVSYVGAKALLAVDDIGLANIVAGKRIVPEFLDWRDRPDEVARAAVELLDEGPARARCMADLDAARARLGEPGASRRAAMAALALAREPIPRLRRLRSA